MRTRSLWAFSALVAFSIIHPAGALLALDCDSARTDIEKTICADPAARAADAALGKSYDRVRSQLSEDDKNSLRLSQLAWISLRDRSCRLPRSLKPLAKCLAEESKRRQNILDGKPEVGDLPIGTVSPVFIFHPASQGKTRLSIEALKFNGADPWKAALNNMIDEEIQWAIRDSSKDESLAPEEGEFVTLFVTLPLATPRLISVRATYDNYLGQAHPFFHEEIFNYDLKTNREITFEDFFDAAAGKKVVDYCAHQVTKEKAERHNVSADKADVRANEVEELTKKMSDWSFKNAGAQIEYGDYAFGGYSACECSCTIPMTMLHSLAKKDAPFGTLERSRIR